MPRARAISCIGVEVEDPARLGLVAGGDVVAGQAADVLDAVQRRAHDVGLEREAVAVAADELEDGSAPQSLDRERQGERRGVGVGGGVVGRVHRVEVGRHRLELARDLGQAAPSIDGQLRRDDEAAALELLAARHSRLRPPARRRLAVALRSPRLRHDDVPQSRLSTGGRRSSISCRHFAGGIGRCSARSTAFTQTQRISGFDLAVPVLAHAAARAVAERLRARHRARHARSSAARTGRTSGSRRPAS